MRLRDLFRARRLLAWAPVPDDASPAEPFGIGAWRVVPGTTRTVRGATFALCERTDTFGERWAEWRTGRRAPDPPPAQ